jgi:hypothetical protein
MECVFGCMCVLMLYALLLLAVRVSIDTINMYSAYACETVVMMSNRLCRLFMLVEQCGNANTQPNIQVLTTSLQNQLFIMRCVLCLMLMKLVCVCDMQQLMLYTVVPAPVKRAISEVYCYYCEEYCLYAQSRMICSC